MDDSKSTKAMKYFRVDVGHSSVTVHCQRPEEAIVEARRQLVREAPRMWDLIQNLEDHRFHVVALDDEGETSSDV